MTRAEWVETVVIYAALALLWVPILKPQHPTLWWALYATLPVLVWIAWRRWRRLDALLRSLRRDDDTFRPLPPHLRSPRP